MINSIADSVILIMEDIYRLIVKYPIASNIVIAFFVAFVVGVPIAECYHRKSKKEKDKEKQQEVENKLKIGMENLKKRQFEPAFYLTLDAKVLQPDNPKALMYHGLAIYYKIGNVDWTLEHYDKAIKIDPKFTEAYFNRGALYLAQGDFDKAIEDYNAIIKLDPKFTEAYYNRGTAYALKSEYDLAITDYTEAIRLNPDDAYAFNNRGSVYAVKGEYHLAIKDFATATHFKPDYAQAYLNLSSVCSKKRQVSS